MVDKPLLNWYVSEEKKRNGHEIGEVKWKQVKKNHDDTLGQGEDVVYVIGRVGGEGNDVGAAIEDTFDESGDYLHLNEAELSVLEGLKGKSFAVKSVPFAREYFPEFDLAKAR